MYFISEYTFPILKYIGYTQIFSHPDFKTIYRKLESDEITDEIKQEQDKYMAHGDIYGLIQKPTAKRRAAWPFLALDEDMYKEMGEGLVSDVSGFFSLNWSFEWAHKTPIIVPSSQWDDMFYKGPDGFGEWLKNKAETGFKNYGILIHPHGITNVYGFEWLGNKNIEKTRGIEMCFTFSGKNLLSYHLNHEGITSRHLSCVLDDGNSLERIAKYRKIDILTAYFQEEMYNILKLIYYWDVYRMKPHDLKKGETLSEDSGVRFYSNCPALVFEMPAKS